MSGMPVGTHAIRGSPKVYPSKLIRRVLWRMGCRMSCQLMSRDAHDTDRTSGLWIGQLTVGNRDSCQSKEDTSDGRP